MRINLQNLNISNAQQALAICAPNMFALAYDTQKDSGSRFVPHSDRQIGYMTETPYTKNIHI